MTETLIATSTYLENYREGLMSEAVLRHYLSEIEGYYKAGKATEHTYRGTLRDLLEKLDKTITATNEPKRVKCGAPDYVVERNGFTIGYIEAKDVGISLDKIEKDEQLGRYRRALDNLILTDYVEFRWYVQGEKRMTARLTTPHADKRLPLDKQKATEVQQLLQSFLEHSAEPIRKPKELARRMARLAHLIRDVIINAFREKEVSDNLQDLYRAFQETLLPELSEAEFADMFAQTLAYGLFAARYNHTSKKPFSRTDATKEIPRTNPFLRRLFGTIAGPDLDDEPFVGFVDELAQILAYTDMDAVLADFGKATRQEDPIVHFYETFLAQYDPKLRELRGVYYTPEPVVSYIVRSVDYLLREYFDCPDGLADTDTVSYTYEDEAGEKHVGQSPRVLILDPATGTSTFLYKVIQHIRESYRATGNAGMWSAYVREHLLPRIFGFELLMAPYAMAHLKLGMQLAAIDLPKEERSTWTYDFGTDERLGIYLTNTLDEAIKRSQVMFGRYISDEANEAAKVKQAYPVMVILGNPPYSYASANRSWKLEDGQKVPNFIGKLLQDYYKVDGLPLGERNSKGLQDDYVKFIRFAQWRIDQTGYGILAFITNHGYLDNATFRGMRQKLMQSFDDIYVLDLHGSVKKGRQSPDGSKDENVFDIQQGVAISIFVKRLRKEEASRAAIVHHAQLWGSREVSKQNHDKKDLIGGKYQWLATNSMTTTEWTTVHPQPPFYFFKPHNTDLLVEYEQGLAVTSIFPVNSVGLYTARDALAINWNPTDTWEVVNDFIGLPPELARAKYNLGDDSRDWRVTLAQKDIESSGPSKSKIVPILYRPFDTRYTYYTGVSRGFICMPRSDVMRHMQEGKNLGLITNRQVNRQFQHVLCARNLTNDCTISAETKERSYLFPLYCYPDSKQISLFTEETPTSAPGGRRPNLAPTFTKDLADKLKMRFIQDGKGDLQQTFGPEDIFHYVYAVFHSPTYRTRYAEFLKIGFPRLPLTSNPNLFRTLCSLGGRLVELHLLEKIGKMTTPYPENGNHVVEKIDYTCPANEPEKGRVWINKTQYFEGVTPEVWEFHIGGYQVCSKWLKDRKGRQLEFKDIQHYQRIVAALNETITLMEQIDEAIEDHGGWPIGLA
jgi:predicted helicase